MPTPVKQRRAEAAPAPPVRTVRLGPRDVVVERRSDGTLHLTSPHALAPYPEKLTERLEHWAATAPARTYLAQRDAAGNWRKVSYGEALAAVRRIGAALLARGSGLAKGIELARVIAGNAPMTNFAVTQVLPRIAESDPASGYVTEALIAAIAQGDDEAKARLKAFLEKRAPKVVRDKVVRNKTARH